MAFAFIEEVAIQRQASIEMESEVFMASRIPSFLPVRI
jgi:hypothetical protein